MQLRIHVIQPFSVLQLAALRVIGLLQLANNALVEFDNCYVLYMCVCVCVSVQVMRETKVEKVPWGYRERRGNWATRGPWV